ncbi:MAG: hypothetical protein KatS3mg023_1232 [Armatimonadota bacterium]|nr:MAG: hypothetical protein KatS3mg023_1232 [Armatimonadota bacterium]
MRHLWYALLVAGLALTGCGGGGGVGLLPDTTPPTIHTLLVLPEELIVSGTEIMVQVTVTDDRGVQNAEVVATYPDGTQKQYAMQAGSGSEYNVRFIAQWDMSRATGAALRIQVMVMDAANNTAVAEKSLSTPLPPPESPF